MTLNSPPVHQLTLMVDVVSVPPYIFSLKLKDPTWSASLRGVLGSVNISICDCHEKNNVFFMFLLFLIPHVNTNNINILLIRHTIPRIIRLEDLNRHLLLIPNCSNKYRYKKFSLKWSSRSFHLK